MESTSRIDGDHLLNRRATNINAPTQYGTCEDLSTDLYWHVSNGQFATNANSHFPDISGERCEKGTEASALDSDNVLRSIPLNICSKILYHLYWL